MFADWLWALTFGSDYLHTSSALSNVIIASQNKVVHCDDFLCQSTGMLSTSTLNDSVSVDNTKALVFPPRIFPTERRTLTTQTRAK